MIVHVASTSAVSVNNTTASSGNLTTTGANLIIVGASWFVGAANMTVTDTIGGGASGNVWTALTQRTSTNSTHRTQLFYCVAPNVGANHNFTITGSGGNGFPLIGVVAVSGAHASPFDQQSGFGHNGGVATIQPGSLTPPADGCLLVSQLTPAANYVSINSGFTGNGKDGTANAVSGAIAYKIQTIAGAENPTWTYAANQVASAAMATFKPAAFKSAYARGSNQLIGVN